MFFDINFGGVGTSTFVDPGNLNFRPGQLGRLAGPVGQNQNLSQSKNFANKKCLYISPENK